MTADQFEKLAQMMKGLNEHIDERFDDIEQRLDDHDARIASIGTRFDQLDLRADGLGRSLAHVLRQIDNLEGFGVEFIDHGRRIIRVEKKLGMPTPGIKY